LAANPGGLATKLLWLHPARISHEDGSVVVHQEPQHEWLGVCAIRTQQVKPDSVPTEENLGRRQRSASPMAASGKPTHAGTRSRARRARGASPTHSCPHASRSWTHLRRNSIANDARRFRESARPPERDSTKDSIGSTSRSRWNPKQLFICRRLGVILLLAKESQSELQSGVVASLHLLGPLVMRSGRLRCGK
jgi:hypothetical protein